MTNAVGIDLGTSTIKLTCGDMKYKIPSVIGTPNPGWTGMATDKSWLNNLIIDDDGNSTLVNVQVPGCSWGFINLEPFIVENNAQKLVKIGNADVRFMESGDIVEIGIDAVKNDPALLLCNRPECVWCNDSRDLLGVKK